MLRIIGEPWVDVQAPRRLHIGYASMLDQANSLKLELACRLSCLHDLPPAPLKHLTRCLRNRVQAMPRSSPPASDSQASVLKTWAHLIGNGRLLCDRAAYAFTRAISIFRNLAWRHLILEMWSSAYRVAPDV